MARTACFLRLCSLVLGTGLACGLLPPTQAQTTPTTQQMIEQLKTPPRTRGLTRNLQVERAPAEGAPAAAAPAEPAAAAAGMTGVVTAPVQSATAVATEPIASVPPPRPSLSLLIQFDFDSVRVRPESRQALANLAQALQSSELLASRFAVEGHTDAKGSADYNARLSQRRAEAVRDFLGSQGIAVQRLEAAGKGASALANPAEPYAAENRRVLIVNLD
jgi:OmpA-OmpF porin, OOP family